MKEDWSFEGEKGEEVKRREEIGIDRREGKRVVATPLWEPERPAL